MPSPDQYAALGGAVAATIMGAIAYVKNRETKKVKTKNVEVEAKAVTEKETSIQASYEARVTMANQLAAASEKMAIQWKELYEKKDTELIEYREDVHKKNGINNEIMINLQRENAELKAQTNMQPVLEVLLEMKTALKVIIEQTKK